MDLLLHQSLRIAYRVAFVLLATLVLPASSAAQEDTRARGDSLRNAGHLGDAIRAYDAASAEGDDVAYALASTYAFAPIPTFADSAFKYLRIALAREETVKPLYDPDLFYLTEDERWAQVESTQLDKLKDQVTGTFDREHARELLRIRMREWAYRYHVMLAYRTLGPDNPIVTALSKVMVDHHKANEAHLLPLLDERGWPDLSAVGEEAAYAAGNVINHSDLATRETYLPMLKSACERGEADWSRYAHIFDRTELERGHPQVYGTQMEPDGETGRYVPRRMVDPENAPPEEARYGV